VQARLAGAACFFAVDVRAVVVALRVVAALTRAAVRRRTAARAAATTPRTRPLLWVVLVPWSAITGSLACPAS
jgi:hypothetical protein